MSIVETKSYIFYRRCIDSLELIEWYGYRCPTFAHDNKRSRLNPKFMSIRIFHRDLESFTSRQPSHPKSQRLKFRGIKMGCCWRIYPMCSPATTALSLHIVGNSNSINTRVDTVFIAAKFGDEWFILITSRFGCPVYTYKYHFF